MRPPPPLAQTLGQILREREPNFFRLYLNPHVVRTCFCLDRLVRTTWAAAGASRQGRAANGEDYQSFLANSMEEALSGAIKLVRYRRQAAGSRPAGLILDTSERLTGFASAALSGGGRVTFLPALRVVGRSELVADTGEGVIDRAVEALLAEDGATGLDPLVLVAGADAILDRHADAIRRLVHLHRPRVITCVDRESLNALRSGSGGIVPEVVPDIVVFDDSFTGRAVPFGAFTARRSLFAAWNRPGKNMFHSTTFQPNTISTRHFMNCLAASGPEFVDALGDELEAFGTDVSRLGDGFQRYFNPGLGRLIRASGFATMDIHVEGPFVVAFGRPVYDVVGGVACSVRGHNPAGFVEETAPASSPDECPLLEAELGRRLGDLTGLGHFLPAVSGASAFETALKLALVARHPRRHILALKAGFGGKTLLALTGTGNPSYKHQIDPLYADVHYIDPFAPDACEAMDQLFARHEFAVAAVELIQSVGGVRRVPEAVIRHLDEGRKRCGYLLLVDEVQTGMYRTGPFVLSRASGLTPDLLLLGKGTSDMMLPFALTLYSDAVATEVACQAPELTGAIRRRAGYEQGYRTVRNVLRLGEELGLPERVAEAGAQFLRRLSEGLASADGVRDLRVFGLLIGIELDASRGPRRWLRKSLAGLYLLAMLRHERFPIFAGLCQYEPNVVKITPTLTAGPEEIGQACDTLIEVLRRPLHRVLAAALGGLVRSFHVRRRAYEPERDSAAELAAR